MTWTHYSGVMLNRSHTKSAYTKGWRSKLSMGEMPNMGVLMNPGHTMLILPPDLCSPFKASESPTTPNLLVAYDTLAGKGSNRFNEAILTIWPKPCLAIK